MESVIDSLEAQHRALEKIAQDLGAQVKAQNLAGVHEQLGRLRQLLTAHLELEARLFYPQFRQMAEELKDSRLRLVNLFSENMRIIAEGVNGFFARYDREGPLDLAEFKAALKSTLQVLGQRMTSEEHTLHPLFRELVEKTSRAKA